MVYDTRTAPAPPAPAALRLCQELLADQNRLLAEQNALLARIQEFTALAAASSTAGRPLNDPPVPPPTLLQRRILVQLADGACDRAIARRLAVSERSVRRHVAILCELAGATNRFTLALAAVRLNWLPAAGWAV